MKKILVLLAALLIVVALYFTMTHKAIAPSGEATPAATESNSPAALEVNWQNKIDEIRPLVKAAFKDEVVEERGSLSIGKTADITGDRVDEALVYLGTGGAYIENFALVRMENDKPVLARFNSGSGSPAPILFAEGASVRNGEATVLLPERNAIYSANWNTDENGKTDECSVEAYVWNKEKKVFDLDSDLGNEIKSDFCSKVGK